MLIGLLVSDGRLRLDESAPVPAWQRPGDPRGEITLRQLLQMRSGLRHSEAGDPVYDSDEVRMLFLDGRDDMAAYAEAQPLEAEPGRKFEYSSATSVILADLAAHALTASRDPAIRRQAVVATICAPGCSNRSACARRCPNSMPRARSSAPACSTPRRATGASSANSCAMAARSRARRSCRAAGSNS